MPGLPDLEKKVATLETALQQLSTKFQAIESNALKSGDAVTISSFDPTNGQDRGQCLTYIDHDQPPRIQACGGGAVYAQGWKLRKS